jgi:serine protease AprX
MTSVGGAASAAPLTRLTQSEWANYTTASGTSFSAPQVAGAIALMLEANPTLTPRQIKDILSRTATPMPKYFYHEAGAGMLNTYAAVLEAAHPQRRMGGFRAMNSLNSVRFVTSRTEPWTQTVTPGQASTRDVTLPANVIEASVQISWGLSTNDLALRLFSDNVLLGESNLLNAPGLTARSEQVVLHDPAAATFRVNISHTGGVGTTQNTTGVLETTQVQYPQLADLSGSALSQARSAMLMSVMLPLGTKFRPSSAVSRADLAEALLRAGTVPQYMAGSALFTDVGDNYRRNFIESNHQNPGGALFYDASAGGRFYPDNSASRLVAAVAFVRAAKLESEAASAVLSPTVTDLATIPAGLRGYVAVALSHGFMTLDGTAFSPNKSLTRIELAAALNRLLAD